MEKYAKVIDSPGLARDLYSKAIIAVDSSAKREHDRKKNMMNSFLNKSNDMENEIKKLNSRLDTMDELMVKILKLLEK